MAGNSTLKRAKAAKNDEFYTQLCDIENELRHYKAFFRGKTVLCNCDDPYESNFFRYFALNFNILGLKKLITTCYSGSPVTGQELQYFEDKNGQLSFVEGKDNIPLYERKPYKVEITEVGDMNGDGRYDLSDVGILLKDKKNTMTLLHGDEKYKPGDFRSKECVELLKEADVVVTNPPFSLFREYVAQLVEYDKKFVIIGSQNALGAKDVFPLFMNNRMWLGYGFKGAVGFFKSPYEDYAVSSQHKEGMIRVSGITWYTNIDIEKRHEDLVLFRHYDPAVYPKYDNYNAIEVSKTCDIPCDYDGYMGVPITFMDKYNPGQFEIIGQTHSGDNSEKMNALRTDEKHRHRGRINGKEKYVRIIIKNKHPQKS